MIASVDINKSGRSVADIQHSLVALIKQADRAGADALLDDWAARHSYEEVFKVILEPALSIIGEAITTESFTLEEKICP
ncbi:MAG: hypothetical protein JNK95_14970 [Candidatus Competibacter sp.]|nr:hypothetical protein [Candidatus Competibacter sp.]MDG4607457.1 hypothetical protein [Candidatus Contendobacter sp.]HRD50569.1 hypothetical protein [Candidatus Contendobacter sp.]